MFVGKWNKSVILTYIGMAAAIWGMYCVIVPKKIALAFCCLIVAGVCDLFDGMVARRCKRTKEEKLFGIQLDSLVDVISFLALPTVILFGMSTSGIVQVLVAVSYCICGVARLGHFNIVSEEETGGSSAVKCYQGLPVTYAALIFPIAYLVLEYLLTGSLLAEGVLPEGSFVGGYSLVMMLTALFFVINVKIPKPRGIAYVFLMLLAVAVLVLFGMKM